MIEGLKERFVSIRKEKNLNVKEFAKELDMEATTVSSIEAGKREPSKEVLLNLASKYMISLNWIFTGEGEMLIDAQNTKIQKLIAEKDTEIAELKKLVAQVETHESLLQNLEASNQTLEAKCNALRDELLEKYRDIANLQKRVLVTAGLNPQ